MNTTDSVNKQAAPQDVVAKAGTWGRMDTAPVGDPRAVIDLWDADENCRRPSCFWHEGAWCYDDFDACGEYRVLIVRNPSAWMPEPAAPGV